MEIKWEEGFKISADIDNNTVHISANKEGLKSLSNILLSLSEEKNGSHIHLDEYNSLEDGSTELIVEKVDD